jgi:hypothetical protein
MAAFRELRRRSLVPLAGIGIALYYVMVFAPLARKDRSLDEPLQKSWRKLAASLDQTNSAVVDFRHITNELFETRQALSTLETDRSKIAARVELGASVRARLSMPFQFVDYENERGRQMEDLTKLAKQNGITLDASALAGLPEYTADARQPELLWAALAMANDLATTAMLCKVSTIHALHVSWAPSGLPFTDAPALAEVPLQIELSGSVTSAANFLQMLPLRGDEARAGGLAGVAEDKRALYLDRLIMKKQSPLKPDEVRIALRVTGFVLRE